MKIFSPLSTKACVFEVADFSAVFFHISNFDICHEILTDTNTKSVERKSEPWTRVAPGISFGKDFLALLLKSISSENKIKLGSDTKYFDEISENRRMDTSNDSVFGEGKHSTGSTSYGYGFFPVGHGLGEKDSFF